MLKQLSAIGFFVITVLLPVHALALSDLSALDDTWLIRIRPWERNRNPDPVFTESLLKLDGALDFLADDIREEFVDDPTVTREDRQRWDAFRAQIQYP